MELQYHAQAMKIRRYQIRRYYQIRKYYAIYSSDHQKIIPASDEHERWTVDNIYYKLIRPCG